MWNCGRRKYSLCISSNFKLNLLAFGPWQVLILEPGFTYQKIWIWNQKYKHFILHQKSYANTLSSLEAMNIFFSVCSLYICKEVSLYCFALWANQQDFTEGAGYRPWLPRVISGLSERCCSHFTHLRDYDQCVSGTRRMCGYVCLCVCCTLSWWGREKSYLAEAMFL